MNNPLASGYQTLISPAQLVRLTAEPVTAKVVIVDCRFSLTEPDRGRSEYLEGHIPGAWYAHLDDDLAGPITTSSGRHPLPEPGEFGRFLAQMGVADDVQVVCYDHGAGAIAARLWWLLRWVGHDQVAVLDGGFKAWVREGYPVTDEVPAVDRRGEFDVPAQRVDDSIWLGTSQLVDESKNLVVLDARSAERFRGDVEPIDRKAGHIPGAINADFMKNLGADGRFLSASSLRSRFLSIEQVAAADADSKLGAIVHSCGSGVTACHNLLAMEIAGLTGSRLYPGSWSEWIADDSRPIATGDD